MRYCRYITKKNKIHNKFGTEVGTFEGGFAKFYKIPLLQRAYRFFNIHYMVSITYGGKQYSEKNSGKTPGAF